jgi:hypothetical protein
MKESPVVLLEEGVDMLLKLFLSEQSLAAEPDHVARYSEVTLREKRSRTRKRSILTGG